MPRLDVQLWRNEGRNRRPSSQSHPGNIAAKDVIVPLINMVMTGVSWRRNCAHFQLAHANEVPIVHDSNVPLSDRRESPPEPFHFVAVNARGGSNELCRVNKVRCASGMNVNSRSELRETPRGAGVIEVDVTKKHVPDIFCRKTSPTESFGHVPESRLRPGVEQDDSIVSLECRGRDNARPAELPRVENVDDHCPQVLTENYPLEKP